MDIAKNPIFKNYQGVLIGSLVRELYENYGILAHFLHGAMDTLHFMPPLVVEKKHIDKVVSSLDEIFSRGIGDATLKFIVKNLRNALI
jgi:acetylornithine/succinyldiaminopimelate/putrescine aminotransferase